MWHFCYTVGLHFSFIYSTIMFYTTISLIKYVCMCLFVVAITIAIAFAVLVMVSKAKVLYCINHLILLCILAKINISFIHSWKAGWLWNLRTNIPLVVLLSRVLYGIRLPTHMNVSSGFYNSVNTILNIDYNYVQHIMWAIRYWLSKTIKCCQR